MLPTYHRLGVTTLHLRAFAGGAYVMDLATGEEIASLNTTQWLARVIANPSTAGEA